MITVSFCKLCVQHYVEMNIEYDAFIIVVIKYLLR